MFVNGLWNKERFFNSHTINKLEVWLTQTTEMRVTSAGSANPLRCLGTVTFLLSARNMADMNFRAVPLLIVSVSTAATAPDFYLCSVYAGCFLFSDQIQALLSVSEKHERYRPNFVG